MQPGQGVARPTDLLNRFLAKLIDGILLAIINLVVVSPFIVGTLLGTPRTNLVGMMGGFGLAGIVSSAITTLLYVAYFTLMEASRGQTVGKMLLNLRVEGADGREPTLEMAFKRNAWLLLTLIPWLGGLAQLVAAIAIAVTISSSPANTGWHDDIAGTRVLKLG